MKIIYQRPVTRFIGNKGTREIHRLDAEDRFGNGCQIDKILKSKNAVEVKNPLEVIRKGWDVCAKCWGYDLSER